jgi:hypothetical protein
MHGLILGMTESGKTSLAKVICSHIRSAGYPVIVLDPLNDPGWPCDWQTSDADEFMAVVKSNTGCLVVVDEAGESMGYGSLDKERHWLATRARHYGHTSLFLAQRAQMVARTVRDQCGVAYLFRMGHDDGKILASDFGYQELKNINDLGQFEYFKVGRFSGLERYRIDVRQKICHKVSKFGGAYGQSDSVGDRRRARGYRAYSQNQKREQ